MNKNMVKVKPLKMTGGAGGGIGRLEKSAAAPGKDVPMKNTSGSGRG